MINKIFKQYNKFANEFSVLHSNLDKITNKYYYQRFDGLLKNKKVLDLGCGEGKDLLYFKNKGAKIYGIDSSEKMVELAKIKVGDKNIKNGYFSKIPFENNSFDIVASKYSMQTSDDIDSIYKEVNKILKRDGFFVFLVVHPIRQFMEKNKNSKDYFKKEIVKSHIFGNKITVNEPSHTMLEYFSPYFFNHFELIDFDEKFDPSNAEMVNNDKYPAFMLIKAKKKYFF